MSTVAQPGDEQAEPLQQITDDHSFSPPRIEQNTERTPRASDSRSFAQLPLETIG